SSARTWAAMVSSAGNESMRAFMGGSACTRDRTPSASGVRRELGIERRPGEVVGVVAERREAHAQHYLERVRVRVARLEEVRELLVRHLAALVHDGEREACEPVQLGIAQGLGPAQRRDQLLRHAQFPARESAMTGRAKAAAVAGGGGDLYHLALGRRQSRARV